MIDNDYQETEKELSLLFNNISIKNSENSTDDKISCTVGNIDIKILDIKTLKDKRTKIKTKYVEKKEKHLSVIKERTIEFNKKEYQVKFLFDEIVTEYGEDVFFEIIVFDNKQNYHFMIKSWYCFNYENKKCIDNFCVVKATQSFKNMNTTFLEKLVGEKLIWESIHGIEIIKKFNSNILVKNISKSDITMSLRKSSKVEF